MIKVLFFAHLRDAVGEESVQLDVSGKTVAELKQLISEKYESVNLENVMTAINEEFASNEEVTQAGDTVAFIPPVSGG
ncbi:molybdopterin converting factor subunit 1 [Bacillus sp. DTU_2020_1000418_1_SI_GHA_SEK_038]|uniref:molybdopterin converting factor subunit 1 n=1 Tax=Bacillus sp. DTU_2020_1000418_1_SI_GHA_SEK_038 TaxID=3077585 RepID=UPI0028EAE1AC|nr:molybdopterin converting factor subunit 1 [Bacillus sp. DTU_2020_1000418_1_SI_GHA_SEK_038]WNS75331.1 molybdopterin converting factor subunit 1 [Bacillus sp. DTU_2020_1000418_1_SI_GHA_SEK_038]